MIDLTHCVTKGLKQGFHQIISDLKALGAGGGQPRKTLLSEEIDGKDKKFQNPKSRATKAHHHQLVHGSNRLLKLDPSRIQLYKLQHHPPQTDLL